MEFAEVCIAFASQSLVVFNYTWFKGTVNFDTKVRNFFELRIFYDTLIEKGYLRIQNQIQPLSSLAFSSLDNH